LPGVKLLIWGNTWKVPVLVPVPAGVIMLSGPLVAALGTRAVICVGESTV